MDEGRTIRSSRNEIELFREEAMIWKDILDELTVCIDTYRRDLDELPKKVLMGKLPADTLQLRLGYLNGTISAFEWICDKMFDEMLADISTEQALAEPEGEDELPNVSQADEAN